MGRRIVASCLAALALSALPAAHVLAEEPEQRGYLVIDPAKGDLASTIDIATSDVCTRGQMFAVMLDGPNLKGADRGNLIGTTKISTIGPESYPGHYVVPLPTDLATYLATAAPGQRIKGDYVLTFACRDTLDTADLQIFTATLTVDGKGRYLAQDDSATPIDELIQGYAPGSAGFAYGGLAAPDPEDVAQFESEQAASEEAASEPFPWRMLLIAAGVLLLVGAAVAWSRERTRRQACAPSDEGELDAQSTGVGS